jgi:AbrB family looped-hinge helix DNA binding protein
MTSKAIDSRVTSRGRVTIPAVVREQLGIVAGDNVRFVIGDDGKIELHAAPYPTVALLRGAAGSLGKSYSWHEMRAIARDDQVSASLRLMYPNGAITSAKDRMEESEV